MFAVQTLEGTQEFVTLEEAVEEALDNTKARIHNLETKQITVVNTFPPESLPRVSHVTHTFSEGRRISERPFLERVAREIKRQTGRRVEIFDSQNQKAIL